MPTITRRRLLQAAALSPLLLQNRQLFADDRPQPGDIGGPILMHDHSKDFDDGHATLHELAARDRPNQLHEWAPTPHDRWLAMRSSNDPYREYQYALEKVLPSSAQSGSTRQYASVEWTLQWCKNHIAHEGHMYILSSLLDYPLIIHDLKAYAVNQDSCWGHGRNWIGRPAQDHMLPILLEACRADGVVPVFAHPGLLANVPVGGGICGYGLPPVDLISSVYQPNRWGRALGLEVMNSINPIESPLDIIFGHGPELIKAGLGPICFVAGCDDHQLHIEQTTAWQLANKYSRRRRRWNWTVVRSDGLYPRYSFITTYGDIRPLSCWPPPNDPQQGPLELDASFQLPPLKYSWRLFRDWDRNNTVGSGRVERSSINRNIGRIQWQEDKADHRPHSYILILHVTGIDFANWPDVICSPFLTRPT